MERNLNHSNWGVRLGNLGYGLAMNVRDTFGRSWKFRASSFTGGPVAYFHSLADLTRWVRQVEEVRLMVDFPDRHALGVEIGVYPIRPVYYPEISPKGRTFAQSHGIKI